ncbi:ABC-F family ATP-binding cassette domain-containing protein [Halotalea alkalilenta]|uniref:ABC-F family ATP-binding cassette domain-containing protein n=1 Tax=Halotalea alkalilenta TaxID=376489 RepID=UPI000484AE29|nr:ATP-binding cassette domain-containing protein [Halotalea alkalilenta]
MIAFRQLELQRGGEPLIEHADLILHDGQKVGIVGANGAGKSSLFKLILGELSADRGEVELTSGSRIAHMAQEIDALDRSLVDYVLDGDAALREVERLLEAARASGDDLRQAELLGQFEVHDGYSARARAEQLLVGLGFSQGALGHSLSAFSGGWRMRANLARTLFTPSDLLLLDEPTNHLDLDALLWLEQWLVRYPGTLLLISHDRDFLDAVCDRIIHFDERRLELYRGNYSAFERLRAERLASREAERAQQQARRAELEDFVRRFRAKASKARQAQSRLKMLERMEEIAPLRAASPFSFRLLGSDKVSFPLLALDRARVGYSGQGLLENVRLTLAPGDRIGLLGPNGAGKSTLIKALTGQLALLEGERVEGEHLALGYFAQHQVDALDMSSTPHQHVLRLSPSASDQEIRDFLGGFDFRGDAAFARVGEFSGGEKARLALALIAWRRPNLLLLDEPTNHLDLEMRAALTEALAGFEGAVVIVSHDRHLLRASVDQFWCVADGRVAPFDGDLDDYHAWLRQRLGEGSAKTPRDEEEAAPRVDKRELRRAAADRRERLKPLTRARDAAERRMTELQDEIDALEARLGDETLYLPERKQELVELTRRRGELAVALEAAEQGWLEAEEALERASEE